MNHSCLKLLNQWLSVAHLSDLLKLTAVIQQGVGKQPTINLPHLTHANHGISYTASSENRFKTLVFHCFFTMKTAIFPHLPGEGL